MARLTQEEYISRCKAKHGNRYDYSETVYTGSLNKLTIICREHGVFEQKACKHVEGSGCQVCGGGKIPTTEEWILKAKGVHGDKYGYSKTVYTKDKQKLTITCPAHGDFSQAAGTHTKGSGCVKCNRLDTTEFINRSTDIHKGKYLYTDTVFVRVIDKLTITCKQHGNFNQTAASHLTGQGCPRCRVQTITTSSDVWVEKAKAIHGEDFQYHLYKPTSNIDRSTLICNATGKSFTVSPSNLIHGKGKCPCCKSQRQSESSIMSFKEASRRINSAHPHVTLCDDGSYVGFKFKCNAVCDVHGSFCKDPISMEKTLSGCPQCGKENIEAHVGVYNETLMQRNKTQHLVSPCSLYLIKVNSFGDSVYKIGMSVDSLARMKTINSFVGGGCTLLYSKLSNVYDTFYAEQALHSKFRDKRFRSPVKFGGHTELFTLSASDISYIKNYKVAYRGGYV